MIFDESTAYDYGVRSPPSCPSDERLPLCNGILYSETISNWPPNKRENYTTV